ncbi:MAG: type IV secretion system DNA-binding domain-containing protein [Candidatus Thiodiazotropha sp. (ex Dulcina madagascariensis)]|nr:type IV secretion system DNA-binding domain-containing protein [Candidatus Thiodiazotropha sp. (ex Dulcina madagascariensis)]
MLAHKKQHTAPIDPLTEAFYAWERRGRGWQLSEYPVQLEPHFIPFFSHIQGSTPVFDDARKPTVISRFMERLRTFFSGTPSDISAPYQAQEREEEDFLQPFEHIPSDELAELQITLSLDQQISREMMEKLLLSASSFSGPISFEVIGTHERIALQLVCELNDAAQITDQLHAYLPDAIVSEVPGYLRDAWYKNEALEHTIVDFGLANEFMLPLYIAPNFTVDPLISVTGALADLASQEIGVLQVLFQPVINPWAESVIHSVTDWSGKPFFDNAPEFVPLTKQKIAHPLYAVVIRVATQSTIHDWSRQIAKAVSSSFTQFMNPQGNHLIPLTNDGYPDHVHEEDFLRRETHRDGMILNSAELVSFVHFPGTSVHSEKLDRSRLTSRHAPPCAVGNTLILGKNTHRGETTEVSLNAKQRSRHTYIIGVSGTGKSTLLLNCITQDIWNGEGVAVLDPHGDLIDDILKNIPKSRLNDVVLFDPADADFPVGFNILSAHSDLEQQLLGSDLVSVFRRLSTSWGDQMTSVLSNAILAMLESTEGGTLIELRRFLVDKAFREQFLNTVHDPEIMFYWNKEFPLLSGKPQAPILTRLDMFLRSKLIRHIVAQKQNRLDFGRIMNKGCIFLAKLSQGAVGEENSYLLGTLLVSKIHQLAIARQAIEATQRKNFYLYIDEVQHFITPSMASILSGTRKYGLCLTLAHQELRQLLAKDQEVASAVLSNPHTRICFRLGDEDARKLNGGFSHFNAEDLQNLSIGEAICRTGQSDNDFNLTAYKPSTPHADVCADTDAIRDHSRAQYAVHKDEVKKALAYSRDGQVASEPPPPISAPESETKSVPPQQDTSTPRQKAKRPQHVGGELPPMGRGGREHTYLQQLIQRLGQERGFKATIEQPILNGDGSVDVSLEKNDIRIACEISVTTGAAHEAGNIQKCITAGYDQILILCADKKHLNSLKKTIVPTLDPTESAKIIFVLPDECIEYLDSTAAGSIANEQTVRGYRVKVKYAASDSTTTQDRRHAIAKVIAGAVKRLKK